MCVKKECSGIVLNEKNNNNFYVNFCIPIIKQTLGNDGKLTDKVTRITKSYTHTVKEQSNLRKRLLIV